MIKHLKTWSQHCREEGSRCSSCGALLQTARRSNQGWLLESLKTAGATGGANLCPACRGNHNSRRIGSFVSVRM